MLHFKFVLAAIEDEGDVYCFGIMNATNNLGQLIAGGVELSLHDLT
jgi:hypothetical protein